MQDSGRYGQIRVYAYLTAAGILLRDSQYEMGKHTRLRQALPERGYGDLAKPCAAYTTRAEAEWGLREPTAADRDLRQQRSKNKLQIEVIQADVLKKDYVRILKNVLGIHAQFLEAAGKTTAAQAKMEEAAKL